MSATSAADAPPDSESHRLIHQAAGDLTAAQRQISGALAYGRWHGPWDDTVDLLRRAAVALQRLQEHGGENPAPAVTSPPRAALLPCRWCTRPTGQRVHETPGHRSCWERAGRPAPIDGDQTAQPAAAPPPAKPLPAARDKMPAPVVREGEPQPNPAADELYRFGLAVRRKHATATDDEIRAALAAWHDCLTVSGPDGTTGLRFHRSPGYTGVIAYEWLLSVFGSMVKPTPVPAPTPGETPHRVWEISQSRSALRVLSFVNDTVTPRPGQWITEVDVNRQYPAAARTAELGDGDPVELDRAELDRLPLATLLKQPGYVQLAAVPDFDGLPPTASRAFAALRPGWWLPAPAARYLHRDHGIALDLAAALTWPKGHYGRRLARWCELFEDAMTRLGARIATGDQAADLALRVVKSTYASYLGGMTRSIRHNDKSTLRPDWWDQYVSQGGVNALRAVDKSLANGAILLGGMKDSFWFLSDAPGPIEPAGMTFSAQPGKWKVTRWAQVDPGIVTAHENGMPALLRNAITVAHNARVKGESE